MNLVDCLGYVASMLVLTTFCMRGMVTLRVLALASNAAFIVYAALAGIEPVLLLHVLLAPMNAWRLLELARRRVNGAGAGKQAETDAGLPLARASPRDPPAPPDIPRPRRP